MKKYNYYNLFFIFIIASIVGWLVEGTYTYIKKGLIINHSALVIGPFNIAYGICACLLSALLLKYKDEDNFKIFLIGFIGGSVIEYIMSLGMELVIGFTAWDYSKKFLNINGRICLTYSIYWGILSILWIKYCYPLIIKLIEKLNYKVGKKIIIWLTIFLLFDTALTFSAINRAREKEKGVPPSNTYEKMLDKTFNKDYLKNMFNNNWE